MGDALTPMMRQYLSIRRDLPPDTLLFFRLGDFYELFGEDAKEASGILDVALTRRGELPMCGVPYHAAKGYIEKLIRAGKRVAICDQVGDVQPGKLVRRELAQIVSAGTLEDFGLEASRQNYLAAVKRDGERFGIACADLSTGEFRLTEVEGETEAVDELSRIAPSELLVPGGSEKEFVAIAGSAQPVDGYAFDRETAEYALREHFKMQSLDGFGCADLPLGVCAAGAILHYLTRQMRRNVSHLRVLRPYRISDHLVLDASTQAHLELVVSRGGKAMTLLGVLDRTTTPMGARRLRNWVLHPLCDLARIRGRHAVIRAWLADPGWLAMTRDALAGVRDFERSAARLCGPSGNARDLAAIAASLDRLPGLKETLGRSTGALPELLGELGERLHPLPGLAGMLQSAVVDEPPANLRDGGFIRDGFDEALDELRRATFEGKEWVATLQQREIERTGVKSLKVRFNSVFGYFIEVTKANLASVPDDYVRKQTTTNSERFITPELKEIEGKILGAEERARVLETEIFGRLRSAVADELAQLQESADALGEVDALASLAETARQFSYCEPDMHEDGEILIEAGRHPVLDQKTGDERFVPNDTDLDRKEQRFAILTGPNMAGKSTYIRQVGLLVLMAQIGSFVPASKARIGLADRIFTRVGASDDLSRGQSTFMVEMNETANIINNATAASLVILDEIGRGTSTFDGLSIAWSVAEYLHDEIGCRTLFATHYHELTDLEKTRDGVFNLSVAVREWNDEVIFLRKIVKGRADQSYGIQVARLAGLPPAIIERSKQILANLEKAELNADGKPALAAGGRKRRDMAAIANADQLEFFPPGHS